MAAPAKHNPRAANLPEVRTRDRPGESRQMGCRLRWRMGPKAACRGRAPTGSMNEAHPRGQQGGNHPGMRCRGPSSTNPMHVRRRRQVASPAPAHHPSLWRVSRWGKRLGAVRDGRRRLRFQRSERIRQEAAGQSAATRLPRTDLCQSASQRRSANRRSGSLLPGLCRVDVPTPWQLPMAVALGVSMHMRYLFLARLR